MSETLPVRGCHNCGQQDDGPRFIHSTDVNDATKDELYHYDCIPFGVRQQHDIDDKHPGVKAATAGTRDDALRKVMVKHAESIVEAPADKE